MLKFTLSASVFLRWSLIITVSLLALHTVGQYLWHIQGLEHLTAYIDRFSMDHETSVPTWFDTMLLLLASILMYWCGRVTDQSNKRFGMFWKLSALLFLIFSIDESSSIHEVTSGPIRAILDVQGGLFYFSWVVPAALLIIAFVLWALPFWLRLPARTRWGLLLAGVLYVGGAWGVELIESYYHTRIGAVDFPYMMLVAAEETMEKLGLTVLCYAVLKHLSALEQKTVLDPREEYSRAAA